VVGLDPPKPPSTASALTTVAIDGGLYDAEVAQRIVYLNLRAAWITWLAVL